MMRKKNSMAGYSIKTWWEKNKLWFVRNKEVFKSLVAALLGVFASTFPDYWLVAILFGGGGAYVTKLVLDAIDYFLTE